MIELIRQFLHTTRGNIVVVAALATPAIVGFCGLAGETGYWYYRQRDMQGAADVAAYDGVVALRNGLPVETVTSNATSGAQANGWNSSAGTITVNTPPQSGSHQTTNAV